MTRSRLAVRPIGLLVSLVILARPTSAEDASPTPGEAPPAAGPAAGVDEGDEVVSLVQAVRDARAARRPEAILASAERIGDRVKRRPELRLFVEASVAWALEETGKPRDARPHAEAALAAAVEADGPEGRNTIIAHENFAKLLKTLGEFPLAKAHALKALELHEKIDGPDSEETAAGLDTLGLVLGANAEHAAAKAVLVRGLAIREKKDGPDSLGVAKTMGSLASAEMALGSLREAVRLNRRSLEIKEGLLPPAHPSIVIGLNNLGGALDAAGAHTEAVEVLERALALSVTARQSPVATAPTLNQLAAAYQHVGRHEEARALFLRSIDAVRTALGDAHPHVTAGLGNLGLLLGEMGLFDEAVAAHEHALSINERLRGLEHPSTARSLHNLATSRLGRDEHDAAIPLLERALAIKAKTLAPTHPSRVVSARSLGLALAESRRVAEGLAILEPLAEAVERVYGLEHPLTLDVLESVGLTYDRVGRHEEAIAALRRSADGWRGVDESSPRASHAARNLANALLRAKHPSLARPLAARSMALVEARARRMLWGASGSERVAVTAELRVSLNAWVRIVTALGESGYEEVMRHKGLAARADAAEHAFLRRGGPEAAARLATLRLARAELAHVTNAVPPASDEAARAAWRRRIAAATEEADALGRALAKDFAPLRSRLERLDLSLADVQRALRADEALVDVRVAGSSVAAWVVRASGAPVRLDLGRADAMDAAAEAFAGDAAIGGVDPTASGRALAAMFLAPIRAVLPEGVRSLVISPDGGLACVPFGALPVKDDGTLLADEMPVSLIASPIDLVPDPTRPASGRGATLVGGVDYDAGLGRDAASPGSPAPARRFTPLPETKAEVDAVAAQFKDGATVLGGAGATEVEVASAVVGRRVVHFATHGFVRQGLRSALHRRRTAAADEPLSAAEMTGRLSGLDPMALAGLALAGANRSSPGAADGVLSALEASSLDLDGVELVVLSACESALGEATRGEGVLGLERGFRIAGARVVVGSLWPVSDEATRRLMVAFYRAWLAGPTAGDAAASVRAAALELRAWKHDAGRTPFAHPYYWASFVAYGPRR